MELHDGESFRQRLVQYLRPYEADLADPATRMHLRHYIKGQLGGTQRKNIERMALRDGHSVRTLQDFLASYEWDQDAIRRRVQQTVAAHFADPDAIAIIDETGIPKKGDKTAGVQRQYCGASGKIDNCVMLVGLAFATERFHALVDLELYLPKSWLDDPARCDEARIPPAERVSRTKLDISLGQLRRARDNGVKFHWATADEFYGRSSAWRRDVAGLGLHYVVEVPKNFRGWLPSRLGKARGGESVPPEAGDAREVCDLWRRGGPTWAAYHVKDTEKGPEVWEVRVTRFTPCTEGRAEAEGWLLIARHVLTGEVKYFFSNAPLGTPVCVLGQVAFSRWRVERSFEDVKGEVGLDHFEVRHWLPLARHLFLSLAAALFLSMERVRLAEAGPWLWSARAVRAMVEVVLTAGTDREFQRKWKAALDERRYYEKRREAAIRSHRKKRLKVLESLGFNPATLPRFQFTTVAL
jgi:SRSO17 transposase